jgi:hypothetical protein
MPEPGRLGAELDDLVAGVVQVDGEHHVPVSGVRRGSSLTRRYVFVLRLLVRPYEDDGTRGLRDHAERDGTHEESGETAQSARAQDRHVGLVHRLQQGRDGRALHLLVGETDVRTLGADAFLHLAQ